jgi:uncharacterized membrane protein
MQNMSGGKTALGLDNNIGALICYLNICLPFGLIYSIIVLVTDKTNKLPRFHAFQSLLLSAIGIVFGIVINIISAVAAAANSGILAMLVGLIAIVIGLGLLLMVIFAAFKAFQGQIFKIPIIGNLADQWSS